MNYLRRKWSSYLDRLEQRVSLRRAQAEKEPVVVAHIFFPQEWILGIVLMLVLAYTRMNLRSEKWPREISHATRTPHVKVIVNARCHADLDILCGKNDDDLCGSSLGPLAGILDLIPTDLRETNETCRLDTVLPLPKIRDEEAEYVMQGAFNQHDKEDQLLIRALFYTFQCLWKKAEMHFGAAEEVINRGYSNTLSALESRSMIHFVLDQWMQLIADDDPQEDSGVPKSKLIRKSWKQSDADKLFRFSIQWCTRWSYTFFTSEKNGFDFPHGVPQTFFQNFLPRVLLEAKILNPNAEVRHTKKYPLGYNWGRRRFPVLSDSLHAKCLWQHFVHDTLITTACARAMEQAPAKIKDIEEMKEIVDLFSFVVPDALTFLSWVILLALRRERRKVLEKTKAQRLEFAALTQHVAASLQGPEEGLLPHHAIETSDHVEMPAYFRKGLRQCRMFVLLGSVVNWLHWYMFGKYYETPITLTLSISTLLAWTLTYTMYVKENNK
jgi:hypothetical protein